MKINNILIIDDNDDMLRHLDDFLKSKGYNTLLATSVIKGLEACNRVRPDLIILDIFMPQIDGLSCLDMLHSNPKFSSIPVIIASVMPEKEKKHVDIYHGHVIEWLVKPIDFDKLLSIINNLEQKGSNG